MASPKREVSQIRTQVEAAPMIDVGKSVAEAEVKAEVAAVVGRRVPLPQALERRTNESLLLPARKGKRRKRRRRRKRRVSTSPRHLARAPLAEKRGGKIRDPAPLILGS